MSVQHSVAGIIERKRGDALEMSRPQGGRIQVPDDLREILLEFTISYLLEQPGDVINYAVEFFTRLQNNRTTTIVRGPTAGTPDESIISDEEGTHFTI